MSETRDKTIHIRVTESEKEKMNKIAESVSMDLSALIRNAVLTDKKLVLLPDGSVIAKGISELINKFQGASKSGVIDKKYCAVLLTSMEELVCAFNQLMNKLPDICNDTE